MIQEEPTSPELELVSSGGHDDAAADEPTEPTADELRLDLYSWIISALDIAEALSKQEPSRELSIVTTKLEEAEMWLLKLEREEGQ
jgi:hypothetical protein